jgi:deazaflavin-dependent oxidoreductase (nitroreductase family)
VLSTRAHAAVNRASGGRVGRRWFGAPVLVLETVGRKSGKARATPLVYMRDGGSFVVLAAAAGVRIPAWWLNLRDAGEGSVVVDGTRARVRPRVATGEERARLFASYLRIYPAAADYPKPGGREIPLLVLEPA